MITFNTYQEAKIANPESEVCINGVGQFKCGDESIGWFRCNPDDYCMTVEKFLADGHKFDFDDYALTSDGCVDCISVCSVLAAWNGKMNGPAFDKYKNGFVLLAAALNQTETPEEKEAFDAIDQPKPKHTKEEVKPSNASGYTNSSECKASAILTLVEKTYGSGALFAVADVLEKYDGKSW